MYLKSKDFLDLDENSLINFLKLKIPEGMYIDYKSNITLGEKRKTHKQFLKDVTAFANAHGGHIFIGVKEPSDDMTIDEQLQGVDNAEELTHDLERLTVSSIDPRISGLQIKTISLANDKSVIAVHVPPSLNKPHMVNYDEHRTFYMRNIESSFPMTTHQIKQSVMESITMEERVKRYMIEKEEELRNYFLKDTPAFFIQAMPLISLETIWDIFSNEIDKVLRGVYLDYQHEFNLSSSIIPRATINGILGTNSREKPTWQTEIHRNGYVSCIYYNQYSSTDGFIVHSDFKYLFYSYFLFLEAILEKTQTDLPYLVSCVYFGANITRMRTEKPRLNVTAPYYKNDIVFPQHYRKVGEGFENIAKELLTELFNAYGFPHVND